MDYQKENNGLGVNSSLFTASETSGVSFQDFFDEHSIDSLDHFVFNNNNINNSNANELNGSYELVSNNSANNTVGSENQLTNDDNHSDEDLSQDMNESIRCDVPFEYVIHEQQNDR